MSTHLDAADAAVNPTSEQNASAAAVRCCACGCGYRLAKRSSATFAPGHDAKFVGKAIRLVMNPLDDEVNINAPMLLLHEPTLNQTRDTLAESGIDVEDFLSAAAIIERRKAAVALITGCQMGRPLLAAKVEYGVNRAIKKLTHDPRQRRVSRARAYKLGRWEYPVRVTNAGQFQRNTKRDASGVWVEADLKNGTLIY